MLIWRKVNIMKKKIVWITSLLLVLLVVLMIYFFNPSWALENGSKVAPQCHQFKELHKKMCSFYYGKMR